MSDDKSDKSKKSSRFPNLLGLGKKSKDKSKDKAQDNSKDQKKVSNKDSQKSTIPTNAMGTSNVEVKQKSAAVPQASVSVPQASVSVPQASVSVPQASVSVPQGSDVDSIGDADSLINELNLSCNETIDGLDLPDLSNDFEPSSSIVKKELTMKEFENLTKNIKELLHTAKQSSVLNISRNKPWICEKKLKEDISDLEKLYGEMNNAVFLQKVLEHHNKCIKDEKGRIKKELTKIKHKGPIQLDPEVTKHEKNIFSKWELAKVMTTGVAKQNVLDEIKKEVQAKREALDLIDELINAEAQSTVPRVKSKLEPKFVNPASPARKIKKVSNIVKKPLVTNHVPTIESRLFESEADNLFSNIILNNLTPLSSESSTSSLSQLRPLPLRATIPQPATPLSRVTFLPPGSSISTGGVGGIAPLSLSHNNNNNSNNINSNTFEIEFTPLLD